MNRPLACTSMVFVMVLFFLQMGYRSGILQEPLVNTVDGKSSMPGYSQDETIVVCGEISDYSTDEKYGQTTTELILKNIHILPFNEEKSKINESQLFQQQSDNLSQLFQNQSVDNVSLLQEQSKDTTQLPHIDVRNKSMIAYLKNEYSPVIGSYVILSGELSFWKEATNPGEFDAKTFYANREILFALKKAEVLKVSTSQNRLLHELKEFGLKQEAFLEEYLTNGNDAIMKAMLLGNKKEMDEETKQLYQNNGIAHILAISGLHISLLGMAVYKVLLHLPLPKWCILIGSELFLVLYCCMVGFSASSFRALVMFSTFLVSKLVKRSYDMITAMAFSAILWLSVHPGYLFDCGFQLSYAAIIGIGVLLPSLQMIADSVKYKWLAKSLSLFLPSLSVTLMTAPILIYHYFELSFFSIALNLIVLPLMAPLLLCGVGMLIMANGYEFFCGMSIGTVQSGMDLVAPHGTFFLVELFTIPVNVILQIYEMGCQFLEMLPIGRKNIAPLSGWELVIYYSLLYVMTILVKKKSHFYQLIVPLLCLFLLIVPQKRDFSVWTLDVGQGDCNVIFTDEGNCFVIDCGSTSQYDVGEKILIPFLKYHGVGYVDGVIVTHPDADHMNGVLQLMESGKEENIKVGRIYIYEKGPLNEPQEWEELLHLAGEQQITVCGIGQGDTLQTGTFRMECLYPLGEQEKLTGNSASLVMYVECGPFRGVFTGDLEADGEKKILAEYEDDLFDPAKREDMLDEHYDSLGIDLLKVGHHGSSGSSSSEFLEWLNPSYAVISCGENNSYGHPHAETIERLQDVGSEILTTPECGAIKME